MDEAEAVAGTRSGDMAQPLHGLAPPSQPEATHDALYRVDVLQEVFSRLGRVEELAAACLASRAWRTAARDDLPWRSVYVRQYGEPHAWEACGSYREQCARRVGLRWPQHAPPLPGPPAPGAQLEAYDKLYGVRTLAVSYDPASRALLRAVRSRALVGDDVRVAVQAIPLEPPPPPVEAQQPQLQLQNQPQPQDQQQYTEGQRARRSPGVGSSGAGGGGDDDVAAAGAPAARASAAAGAVGLPPVGAASGPNALRPNWVCMLSTDGRDPPQAPAPAAGDAQDGDGDAVEGPAGGGAAAGGAYLTEADVRQIACLAELLPTVMCCGSGLLYLPAGPMGRGLAVWDLAAAPPASTSSTSTHAVAAASAAAEPSQTAANAAASSAPEAVAVQQQQQHVRVAQVPYWLVSEAHPGRLLAAAADGSLLVSGCDGGRLRFWQGRARAALAEADLSDLTRLPVLDAFPRSAAHAGANRHRLRIAVCEASGLAVVALASPLSPQVRIYRAAPRGRGGGGDGGDGGAGGSGDGGGGGGVGQLVAVQSVHGAPCSGLLLFRRRMLTMQVLCNDVMGARFGGSGGSSVLMTVMICMWEVSEEPGEQEEQGEEGGEGGAAGGTGGRAGRAESDYGDGEGAGHWSDQWVQLFSSRLQLEHPRTLVLGRMRPLLAATEDLMLLTVPRNVGGRPPHSQLMALELPPRRRPTRGSDDGGEDGEDDEGGDEDDGDGVEEGDAPAGAAAGEGSAGDAPGGGGSWCGDDGVPRARRGAVAMPAAAAAGGTRRRLPLAGVGGGGGGSRMMVVPEEDRLQWVEVVEDAGEVVAAVVPSPRHLALLSEDGRLRLYGIRPQRSHPTAPAGPP